MLIAGGRHARFSVGYAQQIIINPDTKHVSIAANIEYYEDRSESLDIEDVLTPSFSVNFIPHDRELFHFGITSSAYWMRFDLDWSAAASGAVKVLEFGPPKLVGGIVRGGIELYRIDEQGNLISQYILGTQANE
tara:strand:+ start:8617 stop:9018 length:402 start_codon:yes stop_codon:yes gene_type:complete